MNLELNKQLYIDTVYPVGSIYMSINSTSPATLFGGTWERMTGGFLYGCVNTPGNGNGTGTSTGASSGSTGGPSTNTTGSTTLTINQIPSHNHKMVSNTPAGNTNAISILSVSRGTDNNVSQLISGNAGGGKGHTHTLNNHTHSLNSHTHTIPYMAVYIWKRIA